MISAGLAALDWLGTIQRCEIKGHFVPIGSHGFYSRKRKRRASIKQPVEACAVVSACLQAYRATGKSRWRKEAWSAFNWFLGDNDLQIALYDRTTGGCRDGLHPDRAIENQGAGIDAIFFDGTTGNAQAGRSGRYGEHLTMSILAEKSLDKPVMNKYETLFHRHPSNPILYRKRLAVFHEQRF